MQSVSKDRQDGHSRAPIKWFSLPLLAPECHDGITPFRNRTGLFERVRAGMSAQTLLAQTNVPAETRAISVDPEASVFAPIGARQVRFFQ